MCLKGREVVFLALLNDKSYRLIHNFDIIGEAVNKATVR
jgi:hypothetical protein